MKNIKFNPNLISAEDAPFEIVERKGTGHPDTLADSLAATASYDYSDYCLKKFGIIPHHRFDKTMLVGGRSEVGFGFGKMVKPIQLNYIGKISKSFGNNQIPYKEILTKSAHSYLQKILPNLDQKWLKINFNISSDSRNPYWFKPRDVYDIPDAIKPRANDTAVTIGYYPLTATENLVLKLERYFYFKDWQPRFDFLGQDIKILALRNNEHINVTLCVPFLGQKTPRVDFYHTHKKKLVEKLSGLAQNFVGDQYQVSITINSEDHIYKKKAKLRQKGFYLLTTGSALDHGEEGVVGRGNKTSGVISSFRPYSMEAPHGKNPVYHVGIIYALVANKLTKLISEKFQCDAQTIIISRNGYSLDNPHQVLVNTSRKIPEKKTTQLIEQEFNRGQWAKEIIKTKPFI